MRYMRKQKHFSWSDTFTIRDEYDTDRYVVRRKMFSWATRISFKDMQGNDVADIKQRLWSLRPFYFIWRAGQVAAEVKEPFSWFLRRRYIIDVPGPHDLQVRGNILDHEYTFERDGTAIAFVSRRLFSLRDIYGIAIEDGEDDILILAMVVLIGMLSLARRRRA